MKWTCPNFYEALFVKGALEEERVHAEWRRKEKTRQENGRVAQSERMRKRECGRECEGE